MADQWHRRQSRRRPLPPIPRISRNDSRKPLFPLLKGRRTG